MLLAFIFGISIETMCLLSYITSFHHSISYYSMQTKSCITSYSLQQMTHSLDVNFNIVNITICCKNNTMSLLSFKSAYQILSTLLIRFINSTTEDNTMQQSQCYYYCSSISYRQILMLHSKIATCKG